ncbi:non-canonical purine NTP pyrophosphatase, partial [Stenotrophomonas maltophilia]
SGLCVDALDGAPGLFSARWAGPTKDFSAAMARIEAELDRREATDRSAHFVSALVLAWPDGHTELFEGRVFGRIVPPRGEKG